VIDPDPPRRLDAALLDPRDDVATALADLLPGTNLTLCLASTVREVTIAEPIALGHKFALHAIASGAPVRKYGEVIGRTTRDIASGAWVHLHNLETTAMRWEADDAARHAQASATAFVHHRRPPAAASTTFAGFRRPGGRVGVRNHVLVLSPTGLTSAAAQRVVSLVRGTVCVTSGYGRGQVGADAQLHFDTLAALAGHPNVAATVVLSAADDISRSYADAVGAAGKPVVALSLPGVHEDALALVDAGVRAAVRLVHEASFLRREAVPLGELCVAVECGHSDATSGLVCNPLAGRMMEMLVAAGGTAIFSETVEWTGAEHLLAQRAATPDVAQRIVAAVGERERMVRAAGGDVRGQNPGPQNKAGGITTIEEKALGAMSKGGRQPINDLLAAGQRPAGSGLYLMDTPFFSPESMTAMIAGGAHIVIFTTGAGNSYCSLVAPTLKMSANAEATARLTEQIDFAATGVLDGSVSLDAAACDGMQRLLEVASGALTFGEIVGEGAEVVSRIGASI